MKKRILLLSILLIAICSLGFAQSKAKFGHIDYGAVIRLMPGVDTAQTVLESFTKEFQMEGEVMANEFTKLQKEYERLASLPTTSPAVLKIKQDDLTKKYERIETFSAYMQEQIQKKQMELLKPFQDRLIEAIATVAKAENFTYIFDSSTLLSSQNGEDIGPKVKKVLGIVE
jgi:outer membrane protein